LVSALKVDTFSFELKEMVWCILPAPHRAVKNMEQQIRRNFRSIGHDFPRKK
jgi:hypothetical protein